MPSFRRPVPPRPWPEPTVNAVVHEAPGDLVRCADEHLPATHAPWHRHAAFELHLVEGASGLAFVGDWIGVFERGHVVLTGPLALHGWLPLDAPAGGSPGARTT